MQISKTIQVVSTIKELGKDTAVRARNSERPQTKLENLNFRLNPRSRVLPVCLFCVFSISFGCSFDRFVVVARSFLFFSVCTVDH